MKHILIALFVAASFFVGQSPSIAGVDIPPVLVADMNDPVVFNVQNHKFHHPSCMWAKRCTKNCIDVTRKEAHARGGIPCKVCGGGEE
jgi:hypothetical protein